MARTAIRLTLLLLTSGCAANPRYVTIVASCPPMAATTAATIDTTIYDSSRVTRMPQLARAPALGYPGVLHDNGIDGRVVVQAVINAQGHVDRAHVIMSTNTLFERAALAYVRGATYCSGTIGDRPVRVRVFIPVVFEVPRPAK